MDMDTGNGSDVCFRATVMWNHSRMGWICNYRTTIRPTILQRKQWVGYVLRYHLNVGHSEPWRVEWKHSVASLHGAGMLVELYKEYCNSHLLYSSLGLQLWYKVIYSLETSTTHYHYISNSMDACNTLCVCNCDLLGEDIVCLILYTLFHALHLVMVSSLCIQCMLCFQKKTIKYIFKDIMKDRHLQSIWVILESLNFSREMQEKLPHGKYTLILDQVQGLLVPRDCSSNSRCIVLY